MTDPAKPDLQALTVFDLGIPADIRSQLPQDYTAFRNRLQDPVEEAFAIHLGRTMYASRTEAYVHAVPERLKLKTSRQQCARESSRLWKTGSIRARAAFIHLEVHGALMTDGCRPAQKNDGNHNTDVEHQGRASRPTSGRSRPADGDSSPEFDLDDVKIVDSDDIKRVLSQMIRSKRRDASVVSACRDMLSLIAKEAEESRKAAQERLSPMELAQHLCRYAGLTSEQLAASTGGLELVLEKVAEVMHVSLDDIACAAKAHANADMAGLYDD